MTARPSVLTSFALALCLALLRSSEASADGVGITTGPEPEAVTVTNSPFLPVRPGLFGMRRFRDIEFLWDQTYTRDSGDTLTAETRSALNLLGAAIVDSVSNPFGAPYSDFQLIYDYFRRQGSNYNTVDFADSTSVRLGIVDADPARDRSHADYYLVEPGHPNQLGTPTLAGAYTSEFESAWEDTSTGSTTPRHSNSFHFVGPTEAKLDSLAWTRPASPQVWGFNHEFQHSFPPLISGPWAREMFSAGAEVIGGVARSETAAYEVPYTASLLANPFGAGAQCGAPATTLDVNYSGRRLFAAYIAYNFRGADTTPARPLDPADTVGFGDDLLWRWVRSASPDMVGLGNLLPVNAAYFSRIDPAGGSTTGLDVVDLRNLLHHNWRVANYLNAPQVGDGRYGYPSQFGFSPALDVGCWQEKGGCTANRLVAIPPKVTLAHDWGRRAVTAVDVRKSDDGTYSHPLVLQPYGAEYWIARSGSMNGSYGRQLVVTVGAENVDFPCNRGTKLLASVATYANLTDSLWRHPEWVQDVTAPAWVKADSLSSELQFVVPDFGNPNATTPRMAAVTTITAGDIGASYTNTIDLVQDLQYRITHELASAPYPQPFDTPAPSQLDVVANGATEDLSPSWAPRANELAYASKLGGSVFQIRRRAFEVGSLNQSQDLVHSTGLNQNRPDWSPRGDWIAFDQDSVLGTSDVFLKNLLTSEVRRMTAGDDSEFNPVFQPNGQGFAYVKRIGSNPATRRFELRWMNLTGTVDEAIVGPGSNFAILAPRWATDGSLLYFTRADSLYSVSYPWGVVTNLTVTQGGRKAGSADPPRGAGNFVVEQVGSFSAEFPVCQIPQSESYRRLVIQEPAGDRFWSRHMRRGRQFFGPRLSLDGTRVAFAVSETPLGPRDIALGIVTYDHPPVMNPVVADTMVQQGIPYSLNLATGATDPDGDPIYYKAAYLPPNSSFSGSTFSWTNPQPPPAGADGHYVVFVAYDSAGAQDYRVVRFQIQDQGGGCPFVDVLAESGWQSGNSVSKRDAALQATTDLYRLDATPVSRQGRYVVRIRENESEETVLDDVALLIVDRDPAIRSFGSQQGILQGSILAPSRVTDGGGRDLTDLFLGADPLGIIGDPGQSLLVEFDERSRLGLVETHSTGSGPGLTDEGGGFTMNSGGKEIPPELRIPPSAELASATPDALVQNLTGIDLQVPTAEGEWSTVLRHYPRANRSEAAFEGVAGNSVRLSFAGRHEVRSVGRVLLDPNATEPTTLEPSSARHSRLGDLRTEVTGPEGGGAILIEGDTLELSFVAPAPVSGKLRDFYLRTRGAYRTVSTSAGAGLGGSLTAVPLRFELELARPNPTRGSTRIGFSLPTTSDVQLTVFDVTGRVVRNLVTGLRAAGRHEVEWNRISDRGVRVPAGVYYSRLVISGREVTRKIVLLGP